ncbi:SDR family oxidoreductase [Brachybacterium sp. Marseille-Q7125]|uniref:SDR family oxidoreductase n=1 Tax=Brachybacterium sp. Marseille-Q7125 TaxID=2932815 RepID=UPI001FF69B35|nr:SDR family oxidoreductase [Brachybacterium sp. Marseille-Q7125]
MADYLIIGGHGKVALLATPLLTQAGHTVTSVIRNPDHAAEVEAAGGTPLVLDIEQATQDDLASALRGKDAVIWSAGAGGGNPDRTYAVDRDAAIRSMDAAEQAGVRRYVMVSYFGARPDHGVPESDGFYAYAQAKAAADTHLRGTSLEWTILSPSALTVEEPSGKIDIAPLPSDATMEVSRGNVARTIVAALEEPSTVAKTIEYIDGSTDIAEAMREA